MNKVNLLEQLNKINIERQNDRGYFETVATEQLTKVLNDFDYSKEIDVTELEFIWVRESVEKKIFDGELLAIFSLQNAREKKFTHIFGALNFVKQWERDNIYELVTDLTDPISVANSVVYILGLEIIHSLNFE